MPPDISPRSRQAQDAGDQHDDPAKGSGRSAEAALLGSPRSTETKGAVDDVPAVDQASSMTSPSEPDSAKDLLGETIRHEENLINTRLTWMLTFQGFLFAAASLATDESRTAILDVVPWVGMSVAALSFLGVVAAYGTIDVARETYGGIAFGGARWRKAFGRTNSLGIPVVVVIAWFVLILKLP